MMSESHSWGVIIADDGSTDGTLEWLVSELEPLGYGLVVIQNDSLGIARQSNSIISHMMEMGETKIEFYSCAMTIFDFPKDGNHYLETMENTGLTI